jgi:DNA helicase-2/ATP-dependent DNA helicase PcrA
LQLEPIDETVHSQKHTSVNSSSSGLDYRNELNDAQYQAATTVQGPLLIIAGAGTGKTLTMVYRVAHHIDIGVDPRSILLLTFTRRAAEEMLRRASLLIDSRCTEVAGGTFHSFANLVLRQFGRRSVSLLPLRLWTDRIAKTRFSCCEPRWA